MDRTTALRLYDFHTMMDIEQDIRRAKQAGAPESVRELIEEATINPITREQLAHRLGVL